MSAENTTGGKISAIETTGNLEGGPGLDPVAIVNLAPRFDIKVPLEEYHNFKTGDKVFVSITPITLPNGNIWESVKIFSGKDLRGR